jgi:hypothetical protein
MFHLRLGDLEVPLRELLEVKRRAIPGLRLSQLITAAIASYLDSER